MVVAGLTTWWIAEQGADHLVADDYYKEGLAINQELRKQRHAESLNITIELGLNQQRLMASLSGDSAPAALQVNFYHPMDKNLDAVARLARIGEGEYLGDPAQLTAGRWHWSIQPLATAEQELWQVDGEITISDASAP